MVSCGINLSTADFLVLPFLYLPQRRASGKCRKHPAVSCNSLITFVSFLLKGTKKTLVSLDNRKSFFSLNLLISGFWPNTSSTTKLVAKILKSFPLSWCCSELVLIRGCFLLHCRILTHLNNYFWLCWSIS